VYRIANWDELFENSRTRQMKTMRWAPIPNKLDGDGYTELIEGHTRGVMHYACWVTLVLVASRCTPRGSLVRANGQTHSPTTLARMTRMETDLIAETIRRVIEIGWLEEVTAISQTDSQTDTEGKGIEGREGRDTYGISADQSSRTGATPSEYEFPTNGRTKNWHLPQSKLDEYRDTYPHMDVDAELRKARQWCRDNPQKRKTAGRGMLAFLTRWLNTATNNNRGSPPRQPQRTQELSLDF